MGEQVLSIDSYYVFVFVLASNATFHLLTCYKFLNINMTEYVHLNKWQ